MNTPQNDEPQPISLEDAQRIWILQKQNASLSAADTKLLHQAAEWQMWVSHGSGYRMGRASRRPVCRAYRKDVILVLA